MYFRTRAELERKMDAARQLRAETLGGVAWIGAALAGALAFVRRAIQPGSVDAARRA